MSKSLIDLKLINNDNYRILTEYAKDFSFRLKSVLINFWFNDKPVCRCMFYTYSKNGNII